MEKDNPQKKSSIRIEVLNGKEEELKLILNTLSAPVSELAIKNKYYCQLVLNRIRQCIPCISRSEINEERENFNKLFREYKKEAKIHIESARRFVKCYDYKIKNQKEFKILIMETFPNTKAYLNDESTAKIDEFHPYSLIKTLFLDAKKVFVEKKEKDNSYEIAAFVSFLLVKFSIINFNHRLFDLSIFDNDKKISKQELIGVKKELYDSIKNVIRNKKHKDSITIILNKPLPNTKGIEKFYY